MSNENSQKHDSPIAPRSPRYVLQLNDRKVLRYAPYPRGNRSFVTEIHNLSETGMAFTVPYLDTPHTDETIMVEFTPPGGGNSIACFALVKRVQNFTVIEDDFFQKNCKLVAVRFVNIQEEQALAIRMALAIEFKKINLVFSRQQMKMRLLWMLKFRRRELAIGAGTTIFVATVLGLMIKFLHFS
jgi:type III secretory pathway component EscS